MDPIAQFKQTAKAGWAGFAPTEPLTGTVAPRLVRFAGIHAGATVLDVACGTGVVALTAARAGAKVSALDFAPELLARARENSALMKLEADWKEGDAEELPYSDASFDFVVSQFGHMFAPRPEVVTKEMLRVLKPGGVIAFSTWPPELFVGKMFALTGRYAPPPPEGVSSPSLWGDPNVVRERLGSAVKDLVFDRDIMMAQALSVGHARFFFEKNIGPITKLVEKLSATDPEKLARFRAELEGIALPYFENNFLRQGFLLSRAVKL
jgi:SAM-dependent methyltransferase